MKKLVWIGIRESDTKSVRHLFSGSITLFGSGENGNISLEKETHNRINHNTDFIGVDAFYISAMQYFLNEDEETEFLQYDSLDGISFPKNLQERIICKNNSDLIDFLNSKFETKEWLKEYCDELPYKIISPNPYNINKLQQTSNNTAFVCQKNYSCGGNGTFLLGSNEFYDNIKNDDLILVSEYKKHSFSVNLHVVLYKNEFLIFPPSVQIIDTTNGKFIYIGSDYSVFKSISFKYREMIIDATKKVCVAIQNKGYLGVAGIDFLIADNKCYFMEINPRFQASTALLNQFLLNNNYPTLQEYHIDAFENDYSSYKLPPKYAEGSLLFYHYESKHKKQLQWLWSNFKNSNLLEIVDDNLIWDNNICEQSYVFQSIFSGSISSITYQNYLRIQPNLKISNFEIDDSTNIDNIIKIKILLITRGVKISDMAWKNSKKQGGIDFEEFEAITLKIQKKYWITAPCFYNWYFLSPLEIDWDERSNQFFLKYYGEYLLQIEIMHADLMSNRKTSNGYLYKDISYLNPDRLRIYHRNGCALQDAGIGCKFCDLYGINSKFELSDIYEVIDSYLNHERVNHFLIGGGSEIRNCNCKNILNIANYIRQKTNKSIYLMTQPINDVNLLNSLKTNGVTEIAFNIELFDRKFAKMLMPGKSKNSLECYLESLKKAVAIWGSSGNVRSIIMLGFDEIEDFANGIYQLCKIGVSPILSLFRPVVGTSMENYISFDEEETLLFYKTARNICEKFNLKLGPTCDACKNNTISI